MDMNKITVYVEKGSVYFDPQSQQYRTYIRDNIAFLETGKTYYAYDLKLPQEEVARIEEQAEAEQVDNVVINDKPN